MARIPNDEIERLKREVSLERLVQARGIKLAKKGGNLVGLCPFHKDRNTPNLVVTPAKNVWHCFVCQIGGSVLDWTMKTEGLSLRHAIEVLRSGELEGNVRTERPPRGDKYARKLTPLGESGASVQELADRVVEIYQATLKESPEALAYLKRRGLEHPEMIERFKLGYANRTLGYRLPTTNVSLGAELRGKLGEAGIFRASGHEHLYGCVVIPLLDEAGHVVQLYGRRISDDLAPGAPEHLYLPGPHRGVFNREGLGAHEEAILCESLIDALTFWCAGFRNVTAAYGVEGFTKEIEAALVAAKVKVVKIAFDRDEAGERGAEKVGAKLNALGIETYRVMFPRGMDANEYALKVAPAAKSLEIAIRQAQWMGAGKAVSEAQDVAGDERDVTLAQEPAVELVTHDGDVPVAPAIEDKVSDVECSDETTPFPPLGALSAAAPSLPASKIAATKEKKGDDWYFQGGDRRWRVKPLEKKPAVCALRVQLMVSREAAETSVGTRSFFVDTVELYSARQRAAFIKQASEELEMEESVLRRELGEILLELENEREAEAQAALAPPTAPAMTELERDEAMELLKDPKLLDRIVEDLGRTGIVGEETNKLVGYLAATSRKLEEPLAIVIQSSSAAGKSSLMDAVLALMPVEERVQYSAMTGQSLFYMSGQDLKHKILAIVEEEGAERASYALKLLQSEGELTIASTGKDPATGRLVTQTYRVEGPVMIFLTTTAIEVDEELLNRCLVLAVDEGREQTLAIHERQRRAETLEGRLEREERQRIRRTHRNAQKMLRPLVVVNPFAPELSFASHVTRTRRDHMKYLTLIRAVALLHQMQRPMKTAEHRGRSLEYIEVTREDIAIANRLATAVLGRSLDELPPQTRRLLELVHAMVVGRMEREGRTQPEVRFTRREAREWTQWGNTQLKVHLDRLEELEYLLVHRAAGVGRGVVFLYELAYTGTDAWVYDPNLSGSNPNLSGANTNLSGRKRVENGSLSGRFRSLEMAPNSSEQAPNATSTVNGAQKPRLGTTRPIRSYA